MSKRTMFAARLLGALLGSAIAVLAIGFIYGDWKGIGICACITFSLHTAVITLMWRMAE